MLHVWRTSHVMRPYSFIHLIPTSYGELSLLRFVLLSYATYNTTY